MFCTECGSKVTSSSKFCAGCGTRVGKSSTQKQEDEVWNPLFHAYNSIFPDNKMTFDQIMDYFSGPAGDELITRAELGDPESLLRATITYCFFELNFKEAPAKGKLAISRAKEAGYDLGRYWFAYGFALKENKSFDEAFQAFENSLADGFAEAALLLGQMSLNNWANLQGAIDYWRIGSDKYESIDCREALQEAETDPGVYSATVQVADGSYEVIIYSDRPGGLGSLPPK
jgi:tetratricopeptide (TPR) repeat protein